MKLQSYWWVSVPVLVVAAVVVAVTLWTHEPATLSKPSTSALPAAASTPRQEPDTPQAAAAAATEQQSEQSLMDCMSDLPRFLGGVPELAVQGIALSVGVASGDASVSFPWPCRDVPIPQMIALTPHGVEPLSSDATRAESQVAWGCGRTAIGAVALTAPRPVEKGDLPIALGAQAAKFLQWIPAEPVDGATVCSPPKPGFARQRQQLFELPGREGRWSLEFWERMEPAARPSPAAAGAAARSQGTPAESREASVTGIFRLSRVAADGTCSLSAMTQQDLDGQFIDSGPRLSKALGLLSLQGRDPSDTPAADEPTAEKAWMMFDSPGYEGFGMSAIPLAADGVMLMTELAEWLIYAGC